MAADATDAAASAIDYSTAAAATADSDYVSAGARIITDVSYIGLCMKMLESKLVVASNTSTELESKNEHSFGNGNKNYATNQWGTRGTREELIAEQNEKIVSLEEEVKTK